MQINPTPLCLQIYKAITCNSLCMGSCSFHSYNNCITFVLKTVLLAKIDKIIDITLAYTWKRR
jgi:hypothetical protein